MDLETARDFLERSKAEPRPDWDFFPAAPYIVGFEDLSDDRKEAFIDAALTILIHGEETERTVIATVLTKAELTEDNKRQIRRLFFTRSDDPTLISLVRDAAFPFHPYAPDRIELRKLFISDPARYWRFADVIGLPWDDDVFAALIEGARSATDGKVVAAMFVGAQWMRSAFDFVPTLRSISPSLLREALPYVGEDLKPAITELLTPA